MGSKLVLVAFVTFFFWPFHINIVETAENFDPDIYIGLEDLFEYEKDKNILKTEKSSSSISENKRKNSENISSMAKRHKKGLKYRNAIKPIKIDIDDEKANFLRGIELEITKKGKPYICTWKNHSTLTDDKIQPLCTNAWLSLNPTFEGQITDQMEADCDGALILGPSDPSSNSRKMIGYFQYASELKKVTFRSDLLRCNCAYTNWFPSTGKRVAFGFTKQFFYMQKMTNAMYCILTIIGKLGSRMVKIVDTYTL